MQQTIQNRAQRMTQKAIEKACRDLLVDLLNTGDEAQRCYSARAIARCHLEEAELALSDNLYHQDPDVVIDCANALAELELGNVEQLSDVARHHPEGDARLAALGALSHYFCNPKIEALFIDIATGRDSRDQWGISSDWDDWWDIQLKAVQVLVEHTKQSHLATYQQILQQDPEPELETLVYRGIAQIDVAWVIERLPQAPLMVKRKLLKVLKYSNAQIAKAFLFKHLFDQDPLNRKIAIEALAQKGATEYFWDIAKCLQDDESVVQHSAKIALESLAHIADIDKRRLHGYLVASSPNARIELMRLLTQMSLSSEDYHRIMQVVSPQYPELLLTLTANVKQSEMTAQQRKQLVDYMYEALQSDGLETHIELQLIRALPSLEGYIDTTFSLLEKRILAVDDKTQQPKYCASVRQASFDVLSHQSDPASQHLMRTILFGLQAYPSAIEVVQICEQNSELSALLEQHHVPVQVEIENRPTSTLGAISQSNLESKINPAADNDDPQATIVEMVEQLEEGYQPFAKVVKDNFDSADNLNLNRKKIARLPEFDNKVLALRSLGQSSNSQATSWLIESLNGAEEQELREIFQSLSQQKRNNSNTKDADNAIGAVGNTLLYGHELTKQSAIKFLTYVPADKAVPLLIEASKSDEQHVRLCALFTLEHHVAKLNARHKPAVKAVVQKSLSDSACGVRKQALKLACLLKDQHTDLESLIHIALEDEETHSIAFESFVAFKMDVLSWLNSHWCSLLPQQQPNAIKLIGTLL